jgi:hypothetical protein
MTTYWIVEHSGGPPGGMRARQVHTARTWTSHIDNATWACHVKVVDGARWRRKWYVSSHNLVGADAPKIGANCWREPGFSKFQWSSTHKDYWCPVSWKHSHNSFISWVRQCNYGMLEINLRSLYSQLFVYLCINPGINKLVVSGKPSDHCDLRIQCNSLHGECNHQILKIDQILSNIEDRSNIGECNHQACNCNLNALTPVRQEQDSWRQIFLWPWPRIEYFHSFTRGSIGCPGDTCQDRIVCP